MIVISGHMWQSCYHTPAQCNDVTFSLVPRHHVKKTLRFSKPLMHSAGYPALCEHTISISPQRAQQQQQQQQQQQHDLSCIKTSIMAPISNEKNEWYCWPMTLNRWPCYRIAWSMCGEWRLLHAVTLHVTPSDKPLSHGVAWRLHEQLAWLIIFKPHWGRSDKVVDAQLYEHKYSRSKMHLKNTHLNKQSTIMYRLKSPKRLHTKNIKHRIYCDVCASIGRPIYAYAFFFFFWARWCCSKSTAMGWSRTRSLQRTGHGASQPVRYNTACLFAFAIVRPRFCKQAAHRVSRMEK